jgi:hypothetical protein
MVNDTHDTDKPGDTQKTVPERDASLPKVTERGKQSMQGNTDSSSPNAKTESPASKVEVPDEEPSIASLRQKAVRQAWRDEQELVQATGKGTRDWTKPQLETLKAGDKVAGYEGHHIRSVNQHTVKWASDPRNITFVTYPEHLAVHGGDFRLPTTGKLVDRKSQIKMAEGNRQDVRPMRS